MDQLKLKELVKARYEYFVSTGMLPVVAMKLAEENFPNGLYFATPVDKYGVAPSSYFFNHGKMVKLWLKL